jgi:hypothetical protein
MATAFAQGSTHDFRLFQESRTTPAESIQCLADAGYQGLSRLHPRSQTPDCPAEDDESSIIPAAPESGASAAQVESLFELLLPPLDFCKWGACQVGYNRIY